MFSKDILRNVFNKSPEIQVDDESKVVFISDCHRGDGTWKDSFLPNASIYMAALNYYFNNGFTQIEIGDGDDLWENPRIGDIFEIHPDIFEILLRFKDDNRFYMIFGNHDEAKNTKKFRQDIEKFKNDPQKTTLYNLYHNLPIYEGLVLCYKPCCKKIFVVHGHQVDFFNYNLSIIARWLFRHVWAVLEQVSGFKNPTSPAKSNTKGRKIDKELEQWVKENNQPIIAGHTHRSMLRENEVPYYNDGCCVQPYSVSTMELVRGKLTLIKWSVVALENGQLTVRRKVIGGPIDITSL